MPAPVVIRSVPTASVSRQTRHIGFLDHVRGVAILAVFFFHAVGASFPYDRLPWAGWHRRLPDTWFEWLVAPARFGWAGVPIFFVVSGFCIHLSFARKPEWTDFFVRRFFRIYPPYLLAVLFFALAVPLTRLNLHDKHDLVQLGSHLALVHNFGNTTLTGINGAFWSIAIEVQLYGLYPLLLFVANRLGWKAALGTTAAVEMALRLVYLAFLNHAPGADPFSNVPALLGACPFAYWFSWSVGAFLAEEFLQGRVSSPTGILHPLILLPIAVCAEMIAPLAIFSFPLFSCLTAVVIARALANEMPRWRLPSFLSKQLTQTGLWSYSLYLLHLPLVVWAALTLKAYLPAAWNQPPVVFCFALATFLLIKPLAGAWYSLFELRGIALGKRVAASTARLE